VNQCEHSLRDSRGTIVRFVIGEDGNASIIVGYGHEGASAEFETVNGGELRGCSRIVRKHIRAMIEELTADEVCA